MATSLDHELDAPPWRHIEATLIATSRSLRRAYDLRLEPVGLNLTEASVLVFVHLHGPVTQTSLAERVGIRKAATGAIVDELTQRGLVERQAHTSDRRAWLVAATAAGTALVAEILEIDQRLRNDLRAGISKADRVALASTLHQLQQNLAAILGP